MQFFPCKECGAKFPSYYFVHKHKKLWHQDEEEEEEDGAEQGQTTASGAEKRDEKATSSKIDE